MATQMQINYYNAVENARHNRASEDIGRKEYKEKYRHNIVTEAFNYDQLKENQRHNFQTERLSQLEGAVKAGNLTESQRHNRVLEGVESYKASETARHNVAQEDIGYGNLELGYSNVGLGYANLGYQYSSLEELMRHNLEAEAINRTQAEAASSQAETAEGRLEQQIKEEDRRYSMDLALGIMNTGTGSLATLLPFGKNLFKRTIVKGFLK